MRCVRSFVPAVQLTDEQRLCVASVLFRTDRNLFRCLCSLTDYYFLIHPRFRFILFYATMHTLLFFF